jgi:hypothetical protein
MIADHLYLLALRRGRAGTGTASGTGNRLWENVIAPRIATLQAKTGDPNEALHNFHQMLQYWPGQYTATVLDVTAFRPSHLLSAISSNGCQV